MPPRWSLQPTTAITDDPSRPGASVRKAHVQHLADLLHVCLLKGDLPRARRAWAILIRCREVDWRSRWAWGLEVLMLEHSFDPSGQTWRTQQDSDIERWLRALRISAKETEKPALLHALILHWMRNEQYSAALDELDTYLPSYPYLLSPTLHVYAGMLAFYLAQPADTAGQTGQPDERLLRQARSWFGKALSLDEDEHVAEEFLALIDGQVPDRRSRSRSSSLNMDGPSPMRSEAEMQADDGLSDSPSVADETSSTDDQDSQLDTSD